MGPCPANVRSGRRCPVCDASTGGAEPIIMVADVLQVAQPSGIPLAALLAPALQDVI